MYLLEAVGRKALRRACSRTVPSPGAMWIQYISFAVTKVWIQ
jgi:hypothetical protein